MSYQEKYTLQSLGELKTRRGSSNVPSIAEVTGLDSDTLDGIFTYKWDAESTATNDNINVVQPTVGSGAGRWIRVCRTVTVVDGNVLIGTTTDTGQKLQINGHVKSFDGIESVTVTNEAIGYSDDGVGSTSLKFDPTGGVTHTITVPARNGDMALTSDIATYAGVSNSFSGVGAATTTFTVTIGSTQANNTYKVNATPTNVLSAALFYVTNKTTTTFDVVYLAGLTGTVAFDWSLRP